MDPWPVVRVLTSTSAIFTANPVFVVESVSFFFSLKTLKQLFHKKVGVVSRMISLGSYLIKFVNLFLRTKGINITFFLILCFR